MRLKVKVNVTKIKWDDKKVSQALASDPSMKRALLGKAEQVANSSAENIRNTPQEPISKSMQSQANAILGSHFSEKPDAIADQVSVGGQEGPLITTMNQRGREVPVALVVADHPFSQPYFAAVAAGIDKNKGGPWKRRKA